MLSHISLWPYELWSHTPGSSVLNSRQEYWHGLPFSPSGDLPHPGIKPMSPTSPALAGIFLTTEPPGKPLLEHASSPFFVTTICLYVMKCSPSLNYSGSVLHRYHWEMRRRHNYMLCRLCVNWIRDAQWPVTGRLKERRWLVTDHNVHLVFIDR